MITEEGLFSDSLILPTRSEIIGNYFILIDQKGDKHIHIFDVHSNLYLGAFVPTGQGPGEISMPWVTGTDEAGRFFTYDIRNRKILGWKPESLLANSPPIIEYKFNEGSVTSGLAFNRDMIYYTDILNPKARLFSFTPTSGATELIGELPSLSHEVIDIAKSQAHRAVLANNKNKFVLANYLSPFFEIYDSNNKEWHSFVGPEESEPSFHVDQSRFAVTKNTKLGYLDVKATDRYIYLLYSGDPAIESRGMDQGKDLFIVDYDGNPKKRFRLDKAISTFSVYKDSAVFAVHVDIKPQIVKFTIQ